MVGRSGRGDTCLGAYVSMRLSRPPAAACAWAAAVTSLKMERLGPFNGTREEVEELMRRKYAGRT
jgi:sugar/nucleoside kinase (ribokinase family)